MNGAAIGGLAIGDAGLRRLTTEHGGPLPGGARDETSAAVARDERLVRATKP